MSSKLNSICDSNQSGSPLSVLYGRGVFDSLSKLSEESMDPTEIYDINKTCDGFKSVKVIEPPCIDCQKKGAPCVESATARSKRCQLCNLGKGNLSHDNHRFSDNPRRVWSSIKKGGRFGLETPVDEPPTSDPTAGHSNCNPIGVAPEVSILATRKDGRLGKLKRNLVFQDEVDTDDEGSDEIDGEELEMTTPIQKRIIQSTSLSPVQASITIHEVIRSPLPPQIPTRSPTRPPTLASTLTNVQPPMVRTSRDPMSPEPESVFSHH
ncbi:hypothetical protein O181_049398 [Austropuccinia psidii MF-1]|uniref:Uncharacterized protein n=1 Tax=Austropuccinia psidii MF-1 TaxID=1389203 RepID=A0A9Q3DZT1_9BASI|nr:hypothetical protein [Austropuccinia psidii MF-1]